MREYIVRYSGLDRLARPWRSNRVVRAALALWLVLLLVGSVLASFGIGEIDRLGLALYLLVGPLWMIWWFSRVSGRRRRTSEFDSSQERPPR